MHATNESLSLCLMRAAVCFVLRALSEGGGEELWRVKYSDGDVEDLDLAALNETTAEARRLLKTKQACA